MPLRSWGGEMWLVQAREQVPVLRAAPSSHRRSRRPHRSSASTMRTAALFAGDARCRSSQHPSPPRARLISVTVDATAIDEAAPRGPTQAREDGAAPDRGVEERGWSRPSRSRPTARSAVEPRFTSSAVARTEYAALGSSPCAWTAPRRRGVGSSGWTRTFRCCASLETRCVHVLPRP